MDTRDRLRIALVTRSFSWHQAGGGEVMLRLLAEGLAKLGHEVHVLAVDTRGVPAREASVQVHPLASLSTLAVRAALQRIEPDVVDSHNMESAIPTVLASRTLGIPVVVTVNSAWAACLFADMYRPGHGVCVTCSVEGVRDCFEKRPPEQIGRRVPALVGYAETRRRLAVLRLARRIIAHTRASKDLLTRNGIPAEKIRIAPNADEPGLHRPARPEGETILCVGALTNTKGVDVLLEAFARLAPRRPGARLQFAGTGWMRPRLEARIAELGLQARVELLGYVPHEEVGARYEAASVIVFPVISEETFGRVIFEAWGAGVPIVASRLSAPGEVIRHEETGLLTPPGDVEALADALERVLAEPGLAKRLVEGGRKELPRYAPEAVIPQFVEAYREAIG